jgi:hypothetical protein
MIERRIVNLRGCGEGLLFQSIANEPALRVVVQLFFLRGQARARAIHVRAPDEDLHACVDAHLRRLSFPPPSNDWRLVIDLRYDLAPPRVLASRSGTCRDPSCN